ncbi:hypothetical protein EVJ58_g575 [Rhodofomes roseus]|uniref:Uncharacterized protein n=1 Tax=Rhodofomes roseus TaxID=34475 RepID=A0A4Y9Z3F3_9APHY|nr:hypothetical protein EVJ58_g575 [Rhodofomes roseus]
MQDRSYSNRAWAKLAGLPPREIGRCERAVGNVLEWRLWVGKDLNVGTGTSKRPLLRSKSDGDVLNTATAHIPNSVSYLTPPATPLAFGDGKDTTSVDHGPLGPSQAENPRVRNLRRCATIASVSVEPPVARAYAHGQLLSAPLVEEPVGYEGSDARPSTSANRFAAAYDCDAPSPQWFTPPLTYSPMSTSSTSSDGADDRTVQLADFPELSVNAGFSAGSTDAWRNRSDSEAFDAAYPKPSGFNFLGPQMSSAHPPAIVDVNAPYLAPTDTGPFQLPPISVGFPFYG